MTGPIRVMRPFVFPEHLAISKSWLNRALILRSIHPSLKILGWERSELDGEDVIRLDRSLEALSRGERAFDIGDSGTGFRFLLARLSLLQGDFTVRGSARLMSRPHKPLLESLKELGADGERLDDRTLRLKCRGWGLKQNEKRVIRVASEESSQFASALVLAASAFGSDADIRIELTDGGVRSAGYLEMTREMVKRVFVSEDRSQGPVLHAEPDASTIATWVCLAVACEQHAMYSEGEIQEVEYHRLSRKLDEIEEKLKHSSQPDRAIFSIIRSMRTPRGLRPIEVNLENSPDIFPCLAALSVLVSVESGWSRFSGAPHLRHKESDRIHGIVRLLSLLGHEYVEHPDGLEVKALGKKGLERVWGRWRKLAKQGLLQSYDPDQDHRLAFAAAVLAAFGAPICVRGRGVVAKSIPSFWSIIEGEAPRVALIGHRGVGKTSAATRWTNLLGASVKVIDLDFEIERFLGAPLSRYFEERGESEFRKVEHEVWRRIDVETRSSLETIVVAVGAGFDVSRIDDSWTRLWLRRATDGDGRFFSDRPRLNPELAPIEEWRKRYISRESQYEASADRILDLSEGGSGDLTEAPDLAERAWISDFFQTDHVSAEPIHFLGGAITLPRDVNVKETCERLLRWGISRIELRDDIWPPRTQVEAWAYFRTLPSNRLVISFRDKAETEATLKEVEKCMAIRASDTNGSPAEAPLLIDWPFDQVLNSKATDQNGLLAALPGELVERLAAGDVGLVASFHGSVIGLNQNPESLTRTLEACEQRLREVIKPTALVMKLALTLDEENPWAWVRHFDAWLRRDLEGRIFLPIAPMKQAASYGRWNWYRAWYGAFAPFGLSFWREGHGSSVDQPTFSQWWRRGRFARGSTSGKTLVETFDRARKTGFAAVLGQPVHHSRTPLEHDAFFSKLGMPVFAISVARGEMAEALPFLQEIGLRAAAVTAPSKEEVMQGAAVRSVNTIWWQAGAWSAANTDGVGLQALLMEAGVSDREKVAVWGGGGVLAMVRERLPLAQFFGASSGRLRENDAIKAIDVESPSVVLWASGAERGAWPETWKPALIVDLSYTENSMARVVALETGARYVSGIRMFKAQAEAQRVFWTECGRRQERSDQTPKERT